MADAALLVARGWQARSEASRGEVARMICDEAETEEGQRRLAREDVRGVLVKLGGLAEGDRIRETVAGAIRNIAQLEVNGIQKSAESVEVLARVIWYGGLVRMGVGAEAARDLSQCDTPSGAVTVGLDPVSQPGEGRRVMISEGTALALAVAAVGDAGVLRGAKSAMEVVEFEGTSSSEEIVHALRCLVRVIPEGWIVALLPEYGGLPIGAEPQLRGYAKDILIMLFNYNNLEPALIKWIRQNNTELINYL